MRIYRMFIPIMVCMAVLLSIFTACGANESAPPPAPEPPPTSNHPQSDSPTTPGSYPQAPSENTPSQVPEDPNAIQFFDCGVLDFSSNETTGRDNFEEFLNVTGVGTSASIQIKQYTTERDLMVSTLCYDGTQFTLKVDNTQDQPSPPEAPNITTSHWKRLAVTESTQDGKIMQVFRLTNLEEGAVTASTPDSKDVYTLFSEEIES